MSSFNLNQQETPNPEPKAKYSTAVKTGGTATDAIGRFLWIGVIIGTILGALNYAARFTASDINAPQLAALASESLVLAVLPYVLARAWDEVCRPPRWR